MLPLKRRLFWFTEVRGRVSSPKSVCEHFCHLKSAGPSELCRRYGRRYGDSIYIEVRRQARLKTLIDQFPSRHPFKLSEHCRPHESVTRRLFDEGDCDSVLYGVETITRIFVYWLPPDGESLNEGIPSSVLWCKRNSSYIRISASARTLPPSSCIVRMCSWRKRRYFKANLEI